MVSSASTPLPAWPIDLDAADLTEQVAQLVAGELLVVDEDGAQIHRHGSCGHPLRRRVSSGISTLAQVPLPGRAGELQAAAAP